MLEILHTLCGRHFLTPPFTEWRDQPHSPLTHSLCMLTLCAPSNSFPGFGGAGPTDPFSSSNGKAAFGHAKIHIRIQQRNGRKCITTIQGLESDLDLKRICKAMKRAFNCNGSIGEDEEFGEIVQLQGDQRQNVKEWLVEQDIINRADADDRLVLHGF